MYGNLIDPFRFCVYDTDHRRHVFDTDGLWRRIDADPWRFGMWLTCPQNVPNLTPGTILIEHQHPMGGYPIRSEDEKKQTGYTCGAIFCTFLQGVVLGWNTIQRDVPVDNQRRDEIQVAEHTRDLPLNQLTQRLRVTDRDRRRLAREDILGFAVQQYQDQGSLHHWTIDEFLESGFSRVPYARRSVEGLIGDLLQERRLSGVFGPKLVLQPDSYRNGAPDQVVENVQAWLDHLRTVGRNEKWITTKDPPTDPSTDIPQSSPPTCFISYSWDTDEHKDWVRALATRLQENGVSTFLDQWHLRPGTDWPKFVETWIRECRFVLLVCTPNFARKANAGTGGVGYEKNIVTGEMFSAPSNEGKFVPLLRAGTLEQSFPSYLKTRVYVDFSNDASFSQALEILLRHLHGEPLHEPPQLGGKPKF